jgi:transposase
MSKSGRPYAGSSRRPYAPEFRRQMVELVQVGRTPEELARQFEPSMQSIRNWVAQAARDTGRGDGSLTTAEREELGRLRRENRQHPYTAVSNLSSPETVSTWNEMESMRAMCSYLPWGTPERSYCRHDGISLC